MIKPRRHEEISDTERAELTEQVRAAQDQPDPGRQGIRGKYGPVQLHCPVCRSSRVQVPAAGPLMCITCGREWYDEQAQDLDLVTRPGDPRTRWLVEQRYEVVYRSDVLATTEHEAEERAYKQYRDGLLEPSYTDDMGIVARPATAAELAEYGDDIPWPESPSDQLPPPRPHEVIELPQEDQ